MSAGVQELCHSRRPVSLSLTHCVVFSPRCPIVRLLRLCRNLTKTQRGSQLLRLTAFAESQDYDATVAAITSTSSHFGVTGKESDDTVRRLILSQDEPLAAATPPASPPSSSTPEVAPSKALTALAHEIVCVITSALLDAVRGGGMARRGVRLQSLHMQHSAIKAAILTGDGGLATLQCRREWCACPLGLRRQAVIILHCAVFEAMVTSDRVFRVGEKTAATAGKKDHEIGDELASEYMQRL